MLIVEDHILIAEARRDQFEELGADVRTKRSVEEALAVEACSPAPDFALLDVDLEDGEVWPVARHLRSLGIPFVFCTGRMGPTPSEFEGVPMLPKLALIATVLNALTALEPA